MTAYGLVVSIEPEDDSSDDIDEDLDRELKRDLDLDKDPDSPLDRDPLLIVFRRIEIDAAAKFVVEKVDDGETFFDGTTHFQPSKTNFSISTHQNKYFGFLNYISLALLTPLVKLHVILLLGSGPKRQVTYAFTHGEVSTSPLSPSPPSTPKH